MSARTNLILASKSPRRRELLREAGFDARVVLPTIDDGELTAPHSACALQWVASLAHLKASSVWQGLDADERATSTVLGSDTVVLSGDTIIGQPPDAEAARAVIERLAGSSHTVASGVALLSSNRRRIFVDTTCVCVGALDEATIRDYIDSGEWRGKAGGYNYADRVEAGWSLTCEGDPTTIMGLPMRRLRNILSQGDPRVH